MPSERVREEVGPASLAMKSGVTTGRSGFQVESRPLFRSAPRATDKTYCRWAPSWIFQVSRNELGISPQDFRTMTSATRTTLWHAQRAIQASGILESGIRARAHCGPHLPELRRGGGHPHRYDHQGSTCTKSSPPSSGRSSHTGSGEGHRTGGEVRTHGPPTTPRFWDDSTAPPPASSATATASWAQLCGFRCLRHLPGRHLQRPGR